MSKVNTAQKALFSIGTGISGLTSNYKGFYKDRDNNNAKIGHQKFYSNAGLRLTLGYYNYRNWKEEVKAKLCYNFIRFLGGPIYKITPIGTPVNNLFLWDDKNRPYYLNLNLSYFLNESTQIKQQ